MTTPRDVVVAIVLFAALALYAWYLNRRDRLSPRPTPESVRAAALCDLVSDTHNGVTRVRVHHTDQRLIDALDREAARRHLVAHTAYSAALGVGRITLTRP